MKLPALIVLFGLILPTSACEGRATITANEQAPTTSTPKAVEGPIAISVDANGYHPGSVQAPAGKVTRLVFTRTSDEGCGQQLVFPALGVRKDLPLKQPVAVDVTMPASGSVAFTCGMNMMRGAIVVQ